MHGSRIKRDVERGARVTLSVNGQSVPAFAGEMIATALIAADMATFRGDHGSHQGVFCNMGVCGACQLFVRRRGETRAAHVRSCLVEAEAGMTIATERCDDDR